ncbi:metallophosphoesterase [bacterium]|nr:MAG: metallophosphoesterase [bacterium]
MRISRRDALVAGVGSFLMPSVALAKTKGTLRVAHLTDFHCQPELGAAKGTEMAMTHAMREKPDLVLVGGDIIMDGVAQNEARTELQWKLYRDRMNSIVNVPIYHTLGNHDVWGWNKAASGTTGSEDRWGKNWFLKEFGHAKTYRSFDQGAWHFVVLDTLLQTPDGYNGFLDAEQMDWLKTDLGRTKRPTLLISHIPLFSITPLASAYDAKTGEWTVGGNVMTKNIDAIREVFAANPHVKVALSGHTHLLDRVDYNGVSYLCGGAVCGAWWKGSNGPFPPGYRLLDLNDDGTFGERYVPWGWTSGLS